MNHSLLFQDENFTNSYDNQIIQIPNYINEDQTFSKKCNRNSIKNPSEDTNDEQIHDSFKDLIQYKINEIATIKSQFYAKKSYLCNKKDFENKQSIRYSRKTSKQKLSIKIDQNQNESKCQNSENSFSDSSSQDESEIDQIEIQRKKSLIFQRMLQEAKKKSKFKKLTISDFQILTYKNLSYGCRLFLYIFQDFGPIIVLCAPMALLQIYLNKEYFMIPCQNLKPNYPRYCQDKSLSYKIRQFLWNDLGSIIFQYFSISSNFENPIILKIYAIFSAIIFAYINIFVNYQDGYAIMWVLSFLYLILQNLYMKLKILNIIEKSFYPILITILFTIFSLFISGNPYNIDSDILYILQNIYTGVFKFCIIKYFMLKLRINVKNFIDIRMQIIILFMQDSGFNFNNVFKYSIEELLMKGFFVQWAIMQIYNYTQFHFLLWIIQKIMKILWSAFFKNKYEVIRIKISVIIHSILWCDIDEMFKVILKNHYDKIDSHKDFKYVTEQHVQKQLSTYYLCIMICSHIFLTMHFVFQEHIPYPQDEVLILYYTKNPNLQNPNKIQPDIFNINQKKFILIISINVSIFICTYLYFQYKKIKLFSMKQLNKPNLIFRIFFSFTCVFSLTAQCFK